MILHMHIQTRGVIYNHSVLVVVSFNLYVLEINKK